MISLKRKQSGFTIVELLIVIVVIGILAAIVITTFTNVQKKGRDADRKADVQSLASQAEVYFAENSKYPTATELAGIQGVTADLLEDPNGATTLITDADEVPAANSSTYQYAYILTPEGCDNGANGDCTDFTLSANLESDATNNFVKEGSNTP